MRGFIKVNIYDTDDTLADTFIIKEGGACFTIHGGHTFQCMEDHTFLIEVKTGTYLGQLKDKEFIHEG